MASAEEVETERVKFEDWVKDYKVVEKVPGEEFDISGHDPLCVWTEYNYFDRDATGIREGYLEFFDDISQTEDLAAVGYFVSRKPRSSGSTGETPLASVLLDCDDCTVEGHSDGLIDGEECPSCDGFRGDWIEFEIK